MLEIEPQTGPQRAFCETEADIAIYGGAAGGGKTWALVYEAAQNIHVTGYSGIIFRRTHPELTGAGSVWEEAQLFYPQLGGRSRQTPTLDWRFPEGAILQFGHLQQDRHKLSHQGRQYAFIGFDELTHFTEGQFWYLVSRNRTTCGVAPRIRATCNPDPDSFVRKLISWWIDENGYAIPERSGVVRYFVRIEDDLHWSESREELEAEHGQRAMSLTFIAASLADNPALTDADPGYESRLKSLHKVERQRLLEGNWDVRPSAGMYFRTEWFQRVATRPAPAVRTVRCWDKAATKPSPTNPDPDWTRGVLVSLLSTGQLCIEDVASIRGTPGEVEELIKRTAAADGFGVVQGFWQDPGQAGVVDVDRMQKMLLGSLVRVVRASKDKVTYAEAWSPQVERGEVCILSGPWADAFMSEAQGFPDAAHDDQVDAASLAVQVLASLPSVSGVNTSGQRRTKGLRSSY